MGALTEPMFTTHGAGAVTQHARSIVEWHPHGSGRTGLQPVEANIISRSLQARVLRSWHRSGRLKLLAVSMRYIIWAVGRMQHVRRHVVGKGVISWLGRAQK